MVGLSLRLPKNDMNFEHCKKLPLADIAIDRLGYKPNKSHDSRMWRSLVAPNGTKIITKSTPNEQGHYLFRCSEQEASGSIIDLLVVVHGYSFSEVREFFKAETPFSPPLKTPPPSPIEEGASEDNTAYIKQVMESQPNAENSPMNNYLAQRGISIETMKYFGVGSSETFITPLYRRDGNRWLAQTFIKYLVVEGKRLRFFAKNLQKRGAYSILKEAGRPLKSFDKLILFESPIDALSYFQLHGEEGIYASICGSLTNDFLANLEGDLTHLSVREAVIAFDNDKAAEAMRDKVIQKIPDSIEKSIKKPLKKDWNDDLIASIPKNSQYSII